MTEALEQAGVDPDATPVDQLPERGAWAIVQDYADQNGEVFED